MRSTKIAGRAIADVVYAHLLYGDHGTTSNKNVRGRTLGCVLETG